MSRFLRPHHGMCFQFYEGKGYSEEFTDHMGRVITDMESDPSQLIKLVVATDIVCENCPNNEAGVCSTQEKVRRYDEEVLRACGLPKDNEISFDEYYSGSDWKNDLALDEEGLLPGNLKRGVLSEDGIYDML